RFAASTAAAAQVADGHVHQRDDSPSGLAGRQLELGADHLVVGPFAEKGVAHPFDDVSHTGKVDGNFVGEAVRDHWGSVTIGAASRPCQGRQADATVLLSPRTGQESCPRYANVRCAAAQCATKNAPSSSRCREILRERREWSGNGSAPTATTMRRPKRS